MDYEKHGQNEKKNQQPEIKAVCCLEQFLIQILCNIENPF